MRYLSIGILLGLVVGLAGGFFAGFLFQEESSSGGRGGRRDEDANPGIVSKRVESSDDADELRARIAELEMLLAAARNTAPEPMLGITVPTTKEGIDLLWKEFEDTGDLDRLLALMEALLLQGEAGYPRLTQLVLRTAMMGMTGRIEQQEAFQRIVPAFRMAMRHEKELVGYVGYLITNEKTPEMMRTPALGAAMFLSMNGVKGTEEFAPKLLETFMAESEGTGAPGGMFGGEQGSMLIEAMGMLQQKAAVEPLLRMLNDPKQQDQSRRLVEALGRIGDPRAVGPLLKRLEAQGAENRWSNPELLALGRIGTPEATGAAEQFLSGIESNSKFFNQAGSYLRETRSPRVVELIRSRFRKEPSSGNLWNALYGLRRTNTPGSRQLIEEIANESTNEQIRDQARNHLSELDRFEEATTSER